MHGSIVVVGAGHAGGTVGALLRRYGWKGKVTLVGEEPVPPYQRPPLSKAWLKGEADHDSLALRPAKFYRDSDIDLRLGSCVCGLDRSSRTVTLTTNERLPYDRLILAVGARARKLELPGTDLQGVLELRSSADADKLKGELGPAQKLVVIGGGYIGLEAAASARARASQAVVVEREPRFLARVTSALVSEFFERCHRARGVSLELNAHVEGFEGSSGRVTHVRLADGRALPCTVVLIGVGAIANDELARGAGLACDGGIVVDLTAKTTDPNIYAIGDCTRRPLPHYGRTGRLESVQNALEQAKQAASDICGRPPSVTEVPWFWSDQFDVKLQIAGLPFDTAAIVVRGRPETAKFAVFHLDRDNRLQAVEAVNSAAEFMAGRMMIAKRAAIRRELLADTSLSMQEIASVPSQS